MAFLEMRLPVKVTYGSSGGPGYSTRIVASASGLEDRNANWQFARHVYEWQTAALREYDLESLRTFFHVLKAAAHGFRVRDEREYKSCARTETAAYDDQVIGTGDGVTLAFQLKKTYSLLGMSTERLIQKPDPDFTPLIGVLGSQRLEGDATYPWSWDSTTGIVTFGTAPPSGDVTAGFHFDVPVRFSSDNLIDVYTSYLTGEVSIPIVEIRI